MKHCLDINQNRREAIQEIKKRIPEIEKEPAKETKQKPVTKAEYKAKTVAKKEALQPVTAEDWYEQGKAAILQDDADLAYTSFQKAADMGHLMAMFNLGFMYYSYYGKRYDDNLGMNGWTKHST